MNKIYGQSSDDQENFDSLDYLFSLIMRHDWENRKSAQKSHIERTVADI